MRVKHGLVGFGVNVHLSVRKTGFEKVDGGLDATLSILESVSKTTVLIAVGRRADAERQRSRGG